jgi:hypothetical protein
LRRARWTIFWERLWPALATLATAAVLFLTKTKGAAAASASGSAQDHHLGRRQDYGAQQAC